MYNNKGPRKLIHGTVVEYKKVWGLHPYKYVQVYQEDETRNNIDIDRTVKEIVLDHQYNLQESYFFEIILTRKPPRRSNWTPANMTEYVIECYSTFDIKVCPYKLLFGDLFTNPFHPTTIISAMMMMKMTIIFPALLLKMSFRTTKEWKMQSWKTMNTLMTR